MRKLIFATKNNGKVEEVRNIFMNKKVQILSLSDIDFQGDIVEHGSTFEENAVIKAKYVYDLYKLPILADDSGLVVKKLNGEPGIFSARYAGVDATDADNNQKLLKKLMNIPKPHKAEFMCAAVFYNGEKPAIVVGIMNGEIIDSPRGKNGFGYDPLFVPDGYNLTAAEMNPEIKNQISHRYKAFSKLINSLEGI